MYKNVGDSLKSIAKLVAFLGIIAAIGFGGFLLYNEEPSGLAVILFGCLFAILTPIGLYAFGEIVENTDKMVESLNTMERKIRSLERTVEDRSISKSCDSPKGSSSKTVYCPNCGTETFMPASEPDVVCEECGKVNINKQFD